MFLIDLIVNCKIKDLAKSSITSLCLHFPSSSINGQGDFNQDLETLLLPDFKDTPKSIRVLDNEIL